VALVGARSCGDGARVAGLPTFAPAALAADARTVLLTDVLAVLLAEALALASHPASLAQSGSLANSMAIGCGISYAIAIEFANELGREIRASAASRVDAGRGHLAGSGLCARSPPPAGAARPVWTTA